MWSMKNKKKVKSYKGKKKKGASRRIEWLWQMC